MGIALIIAAIVAVWVASAAVCHGLTFAYFQREFPSLAEKDRFEDWHTSVRLAIAGGPVALLVAMSMGFYRHGFKWLAILACLTLPTVALAGHRNHACNQFFHHKAVAVVALPPYYATVSPGLAQEAQVRAWARDEYRQQEQLKAQQGLAVTAPVASLLASKCAKCHSEPDPQGGYVIDGKSGVDDWVFRRTMEMLRGAGEPPPAAMAGLIQELRASGKHAEVMEEMLVTLREAPIAAGPAPVAKPDEGGLGDFDE